MTRQMLALAVLVGGAIGAASATLPVSDPDVYWHLATGRETLRQGLVRVDLFSWTATSAAVPTDQWLGDLILYAGYSLAGWIGVIAVRSIAVSVLVGAIALSALLRGRISAVIGLATAVPAIVFSRFLWAERPELFGAMCFAILVALLQLPPDAALIASAPLLILWANVHGSFALGAVLVVLATAADVASERRARWPHGLALGGALLSFVVTPAGLGTLVTPGIHLLSPPREIQEWAIPDPTTAPGAFWSLVLLVTLATASLGRGARARDLALLVPLAGLSLVAIRHAPLFVIAATPYLAEHVPAAVSTIARRPIGATDRSRRPAPAARAAPIVVAAAGVALLVAGIAVSPREPDERGFPTAVLASLPAGPGLLNEYDWGGWLIWRAPATPVFIDGRLGPYRERVLPDYVTIIEARPGWRDVLERRGVKTLLVRPADPVAVRAQELGWPVVSRSDVYVLITVGHR